MSKNYVVTLKITQLFEIEVSAETEELAKIKAEKMFNDDKDEYFSDSEMDTTVEIIYC